MKWLWFHSLASLSCLGLLSIQGWEVSKGAFLEHRSASSSSQFLRPLSTPLHLADLVVDCPFGWAIQVMSWSLCGRKSARIDFPIDSKAGSLGVGRSRIQPKEKPPLEEGFSVVSFLFLFTSSFFFVSFSALFDRRFRTWVTWSLRFSCSCWLKKAGIS